MKPGLVLAWVLSALAVGVSWGVQGLDEIPEVYPGQRVAWDPFDAANQKKTNFYEFRHSPTALWRKVGLIEEWPIPELPEGEYELQMRACRERRDTTPIVKECSLPAVRRVRILAPNAPKAPTNFLPKCHP